jgi:tight adherence protein B
VIGAGADAVLAFGVSAGAVALGGLSIRAMQRDAVRSGLVDGPASANRVSIDPRVSRRTLDFAWALTVGASAVAAGWVVAGPVGSAAGALAAVAAPRWRDRRRRRAEAVGLEEGLADAIAAVAAGMRAGRSMTGAFQEAAGSVGPPLGLRLRELVDRVALGIPLEEALLDLATSLPGAEGRLVAAVLAFHQRSGGDVAAVLDGVARTLRDRRSIGREVRSLTAQARLSGAILGFLPIGFFLFLSITARADVDRALRSGSGVTAIAAGLVMQAVAFVWIRQLLRVEA